MTEPQLTETGIEGMEISHSHPDVVGSWGGHKAWMVHFVPTGGGIQRLEVYRHVGSFYDIGQWAGEPGPSKWEVIGKCVGFLYGDCSLWKLLSLLLKYIKKLSREEGR